MVPLPGKESLNSLPAKIMVSAADNVLRTKSCFMEKVPATGAPTLYLRLTLSPNSLAFFKTASTCFRVGSPPWPISTPAIPAAFKSTNCFSSSAISAVSGGKFQRTQGRSSEPGFENDWLVKEVTGLNCW